MIRITKFLACMLAVCPMVCFTAAAAPARLAIVAESPEVQTAADLLTATLSAVDSLTLLERAQIEKIRAEQQLSTLNEHSFLKLGQILGADGVLVLNLDRLDGKTNVYTRLAAVKPGAVISVNQAVWPLENLGAWATNQFQHYQPHWAKLSVAATNALPVSVLNIRSAVQSPRGQALEQELTTALIDRLTHEPELFVLERRSLQLLSNEKELINTNDSPFWNGAYLLEGTLDRDGISEATATIHARLIPPKGGTPITLEISGSRMNAAQLVDLLARKIMEGLSRTPQAGGWKPEVEAARYMAEAEWAFRWKMYRSAQAASESAWALGLHSDACAKLLIESYVSGVSSGETPTTTIDNGIPLELELPVPPQIHAPYEVIRALEFYNLQTQFRKTTANQLPDNWFRLGMKTLESASTVLQEYYFYRNGSNQVSETLAELRQSTRHTVESMGLDFSGEKRLELLQLKAMFGALWQDNPQMGIEMYQQMLRSGDFTRVREQILRHNSCTPCLVGWTPLTRAQSPGLWRRLIRQLSSHPDESYRLEGAFLGMVYSENAQDLEAYTEMVWKFLGEGRTYTMAKISNTQLVDLARRKLMERVERKDSVTAVRLFAKYLAPSTITNLPRMVSVNPATNQPANVPRLADVPVKEQTSSQSNRCLTLTDYYDVSDVIPTSSPWHIVEVFFRERELWIEVRQNLVLGWPGKWALGGVYEGLYGAFARFKPGQGLPKFTLLPIRTGRLDENPFIRETLRTMEVFKGQVYATAKKQLLRYDENTRKWLSISVPIEEDALLQAGGTSLVLSTSSAILEYNPAGGGSRVLASSRRNPPQTMLDKLQSLDYPIIFTTTNGIINALVSQSIYRLEPGSNDWTLVCPQSIPANMAPNLPNIGFDPAFNYRVSNDGAVFEQRPENGRFWRVTSGGAVELLWRESATANWMPSMVPGNRGVTSSSARPLWNLPREVSVALRPAVCVSSNLWLLEYPPFHPQSALWCFNFGKQQAIKIPLSAKPFSFLQLPPTPKPGQIHPSCPQLVAYSGGLILVETNGFGFWHVPFTELQPFLENPVHTIPLIATEIPNDLNVTISAAFNEQRLLQSNDRDKNGQLDMAEYESMCREEQAKAGSNSAGIKFYSVKEAFTRFDTNKDQSLSKDELISMLNQLRKSSKISQ